MPSSTTYSTPMTYSRKVTTQARYSTRGTFCTCPSQPRCTRLLYASCFGRGRRVPKTAHAMRAVPLGKALLPLGVAGEPFPLTESRGKYPTICTECGTSFPQIFTGQRFIALPVKMSCDEHGISRCHACPCCNRPTHRDHRSPRGKR